MLWNAFIIWLVPVLIPMIYWISFHVWFQYLFYKFKRHSKLHLSSHSIKNLLTFTSGYLVKFHIFYLHLNLEAVFTALKLTQVCCRNINICFLENWEFNHKLTPPLLLIYQAWKSILTIWQNMKVSRIQKFQFCNSLVN